MMIDYFYLLLGCSLSIELLMKIKFMVNLHLILEIVNKVSSVISSSKISDHWKEKMIPAYAVILLKKSLSTLGALLLIILLFLIFIALSDNFIETALSLKGLIISIFFAVSYTKLRIFLNE
jgi:hypothetical protein